LAFPGGFVDQDESLEHAAERELREETGLVGVSLEQLSAFGDPGRDPRGHTVSVVYAALVSSDRKIKAGDDAATAKWVEVSHAHKFKLAFDHKKILRLAVCWEWLGCRCCRR
jgi:8-oxo-dGTP diphosphatase